MTNGELTSIRFLGMPGSDDLIESLVDLVTISASRAGVYFNIVENTKGETRGTVYVGTPGVVSERYQDGQIWIRARGEYVLDAPTVSGRRLIVTQKDAVIGALMTGGEHLAVDIVGLNPSTFDAIAEWIAAIQRGAPQEYLGGLLEALHTAVQTQITENDALREQVRSLRKQLLESNTTAAEQARQLSDLDHYLKELEAYVDAIEQQMQASDKDHRRAGHVARLVQFTWRAAFNRLVEFGVESAVREIVKLDIVDDAVDSVIRAVNG